MNVLRSVSLSSLLTIAVAVGCSSDPATATDAGTVEASTPTDSSVADTSSPPADANVPDTAKPDASTPDSSKPVIACSTVDAGAQCNTIVNGATDVTIVMSAATIPTGTGGVIQDGRYFLTETVGYAGTLVGAGTTLRQTLEICGGGTSGQLINDQTGVTKRKSFTIAPTGIMPGLTQVCQSQAGDSDVPYTSYVVTGNTMTFYSTAFNFSATFTRQ